MNENNIKAEYIKRMRKKILIKKAKNKNIIKYHDLVNRKFNKIKEKFKVLFTDVTYLIWNGKKHYQSTIIDGYTKEIVDVQWSKYNDNKIVMNNLDATFNKIKQTKKDLINIIIHSDHGFQYTSKYIIINVYLIKLEFLSVKIIIVLIILLLKVFILY
ncbi:MAG: DDE-type integrase/transposase/recombinase [Spiroplasma phoeniceum]|nr:MAG: DDE-type integrase/transposase/recombinase [Spiroplasma phoeniceum]UZQ32701.1 MAG: DDE-type integrase/transposase/recombinase [Spiroplasma phoeniceum]